MRIKTGIGTNNTEVERHCNTPWGWQFDVYVYKLQSTSYSSMYDELVGARRVIGHRDCCLSIPTDEDRKVVVQRLRCWCWGQ